MSYKTLILYHIIIIINKDLTIKIIQIKFELNLKYFLKNKFY